MKKAIILIIVLAVSTALLAVYAQNNRPDATVPPQNSIAPGESSDMRLVLPEAMEEKSISLADVKSIELLNLEGQPAGRKFSTEEISDLVKVYNAAVIDDIAYIEMIAGNRMVITFKDETIINITSYGSDTHIVASGENMNYHLISPEIAKILLEK